MFNKFSSFILKHKWWVIGFWVILSILVFWKAPILSQVSKSNEETFLPKGVDSVKAEELAKELDPSKGDGTTLLITFNRQGQLTEEDKEYGEKLEKFLMSKEKDLEIDNIMSPFTQQNLQSQLLSENKKASIILVNLKISSSCDEIDKVVQDMKNCLYITQNNSYDSPKIPKGLNVSLTGDGPLEVDQADNVNNSMSLITKITILLVLVVLVLIYRSPIAPILPLITIGLSFIVASGIIAALTKLGLKVSSYTEMFLIAVLFGAGTDYCMLLVSRFREEYSKKKTKEEALKDIFPNISGAIISSAGTVMVGFLFMGFAKFGLFNTTGPSVAIGVLITLAAVLTLMPAFIAVIGKWIFWPFNSRERLFKESTNKGMWSKLAAYVTKKPLRFIIITILVFSPLVLLNKNIVRSFDQLTELPSSADSVKGFQVIKDNFNQGDMLPIKITVKSNNNMWEIESLQAIENISSKLSKINGVVKVRSATRPTGEAIPEDAFAELTNNPPLKEAMAYYISSDGKGVTIEVILSTSPYSNISLNKVEEIKNVFAQAIKGTNLKDCKFYVGGPTSVFYDIRTVTASDFITVMVVVLLGIFIVLTILLRSLIAPIYLLITTLLSYTTTMGITYLVFQVFCGYEGINWAVPFFTFCVLVALGIDYNIFLMSRVKEEYKHGDIKGSVERALSSTGKIITSCGIIMAGTFGAMMAASVRSMAEVGFAAVVGLILDTFIIRCLLVPAIAVKVGELNWWPGKRR